MSGLPKQPPAGQQSQAAEPNPGPRDRDREFLDFLIRLACEAVTEQHRQARAQNDNQIATTTKKAP